MCITNGSGNPDRKNLFALVSYIPNHLGEFLNRLRQELVPGCGALAHVTVLPPRSIDVDVSLAADLIEKYLVASHAFYIGIAEMQVFDKTDVIYAEIGAGRELLLDMHRSLDSGALPFMEPYPYHPHVTLAQNVGHECIPELYQLACRRWDEYKYERGFQVDRLTFVQSKVDNSWVDLVSYDLRQEELQAR